MKHGTQERRPGRFEGAPRLPASNSVAVILLPYLHTLFVDAGEFAMRNCFFVITVLLAAGAGLVACSDDDSSSSPLQPSPLATAPSGGGG